MSDGGKERGAGCKAGEALEGPAGGQPSSKAQGRLLEGVLQAAACTAGLAVAVLLDGHHASQPCLDRRCRADLAQHCRRLGVVTLGEKGCLIKESGADDVIAMPACAGVKVS